MTDIEVVKEELYSIDKWVTGLVDLIPTQVYVSFEKKKSKKKFEKKNFKKFSRYRKICDRQNGKRKRS